MNGKTDCWKHERHYTDLNSLFEEVERLKKEYGKENIKVNSYKNSGIYHGDIYIKKRKKA